MKIDPEVIYNTLQAEMFVTKAPCARTVEMNATCFNEDQIEQWNNCVTEETLKTGTDKRNYLSIN